MAMFLSTSEALIWLGKRKGDASLVKAGEAIAKAVETVVGNGAPLTYDLVGLDKAAKMSEVGAAVRKEVERQLS